jgi:alpha-mannosidase
MQNPHRQSPLNFKFRELRAGLKFGGWLLAAGMGVAALIQPARAQTNAPLDLAHQPTLFEIGYSHLDTEWRWGYPQVIGEYLPNTVHDNLPLFEKYPHYIFNWTGAGRYQLIQEYHPDDFEKVRAAVAAGRWWPNGSSWEENDVNVPSSESLVRQLLLGHEFFKKEFGTESDEYMLPDCFGFPASLPSVLAHCGIRGFSTQKLTWGSAVGIPFNVGEWIGPDGNSVIAALNCEGYGTVVKDDRSQSAKWLKRVQADGAQSGVFADFTYFGKGDTGGAPKESSVQMIEQAVTNHGPLRVICARANEMFDDITDAQKARLPKYQGDLLLTEHSAGSLTSEAYMKRWNRKNELLADAAERASVAAWLLGAAPYPREKLDHAWELVLRSQMHDMLPGTCLPRVYQYVWNDEIIAQNSFAEVLRDAVGAVAAGLDTRAEGTPLIVYNPLSIAREDVVEAEVKLPLPAAGGVQVFDGRGKPVPTQLLSSDGDTCHFLFLADVPSVGFAVYSVKPSGVSDSKSSPLKITSRSLENSRYRITLNDAGDLASIFDKAARRELLSGPARLDFLNESPKQYPAWNMDWDDRKNPPRGYVDGPPQIEIVENGPVCVALRIERGAENSRFAQTIRLAAGDAGNRVEIANTIDWQSKGCSLKAEFPLSVSNPKATYNWDLGKIERGNNVPKKYEVPSHQWFDLTDPSGSYGVSILNDTKYGSDKPADNFLRLTLLYSPDVSKVGSSKDQRWQDWGRHDFVYGIYGHAGDWRKGGSDWQALRLGQPMMAFTTAPHPGSLGRSFSLLAVNSDAVAVRAIKLAEDSDQVVVRLQELNGEPETSVKLKTSGLTGAAEVNGLEKFLNPLGTTFGLRLAFTPYQMRSLALTLKAPARLLLPVSTPVALPYNLNAFGFRGASQSGDFDGTGSTIPAEMIGDTVTSEGIQFAIGPKGAGQQNAVQCQGQTISLPEGNFNRLCFLAAAADGDADGEFSIGGASTKLHIQNWTGFIGSWDNRVFEGEVSELAHSVTNQLKRIDAGFIKRDPLGWYCSHRRLADGSDAIYSYSYLFKYSLEIPAGAKTVMLPDNPNIRVVAMTAAFDDHDATWPAHPLYDDFTNRKPIELPDGWANSK